MDRSKKKSRFQREHETYCKAAKYVNDDRRMKEPLSREFLRTPYGLEVKKNDAQY